jgi:O-antigen/teichoic acid export membrane protein
LIAAGRTRLPLIVNIVSVPTMWIGCYLAVNAYGIVGAAVCWLVFNLFCFFVYGEYCRRAIFQTDSVTRLWDFPLELLLPAGAVGLLSRMLFPFPSTAVWTLSWFACSTVLFYTVGLLFMRANERRITMTFLNSR